MIRATAIALVLALAACGQHKAPPGPGANAYNFCQALFDRVAEQQTRCFGGVLEGWAADNRDARIDYCEGAKASVFANRSEYDAEQGTSCLDAIQTTCGLPLACDKAFVGKVAAGGTCYGKLECGDGYFCPAGYDAKLCPSTCRPLLKAGEQCGTGPLLPCEAGNSCIADACVPDAVENGSCSQAVGPHCDSAFYCASGTCLARKQSGGSCAATEYEACAPTFVCVGASGSTLGTCQLAPKRGEACTPGQNICEKGTYCSAAGICVLDSKLGEICGPHVYGSTQELALCLEGYCDALPSAEGVCREMLKSGEVCDPKNDHCGHRLFCDSATARCADRPDSACIF